MEEVIYNSTQYLNANDANAIAHFLKAIQKKSFQGHGVQQAPSRPSLNTIDLLRISSNGARVYVDNCMACHRGNGQGYRLAFPALVGNAALNSDTTESIIAVVLAAGSLRIYPARDICTCFALLLTADWNRAFHAVPLAFSNQSSFGATAKSTGIFVVECR
jgi:hypothetical protein